MQWSICVLAMTVISTLLAAIPAEASSSLAALAAHPEESLDLAKTAEAEDVTGIFSLGKKKSKGKGNGKGKAKGKGKGKKNQGKDKTQKGKSKKAKNKKSKKKSEKGKEKKKEKHVNNFHDMIGEDLPRGWSVVYTNEMKPYYAHQETDSFQWHHPLSDEDVTSLLPNWKWCPRFESYCNEVTKETSQTKPTWQPLPNGWKMKIDTDGVTWYSHDSQMMQSYSRPGRVPPNWEAQVDESYRHVLSGETSTALPEELDSAWRESVVDGRLMYSHLESGFQTATKPIWNPLCLDSFVDDDDLLYFFCGESEDPVAFSSIQPFHGDRCHVSSECQSHQYCSSDSGGMAVTVLRQGGCIQLPNSRCTSRSDCLESEVCLVEEGAVGTCVSGDAEKFSILKTIDQMSDKEIRSVAPYTNLQTLDGPWNCDSSIPTCSLMDPSQVDVPSCGAHACDNEDYAKNVASQATGCQFPVELTYYVTDVKQNGAQPVSVKHLLQRTQLLWDSFRATGLCFANPSVRWLAHPFNYLSWSSAKRFWASQTGEQNPKSSAMRGYNDVWPFASFSTNTKDFFIRARIGTQPTNIGGIHIHVVHDIQGPAVEGVASFPYDNGAASYPGHLFVKRDSFVSSAHVFEHEFGHVLGLKHTFYEEGQSCQDDFVSDTDTKEIKDINGPNLMAYHRKRLPISDMLTAGQLARAKCFLSTVPQYFATRTSNGIHLGLKFPRWKRRLGESGLPCIPSDYTKSDDLCATGMCTTANGSEKCLSSDEEYDFGYTVSDLVSSSTSHSNSHKSRRAPPSDDEWDDYEQFDSTTSRRTEEGSLCHLPFTYDGQVFDDCAQTQDGREWCSLTAVYNDWSEDWGWCHQKTASSSDQSQNGAVSESGCLCQESWSFGTNQYSGCGDVAEFQGSYCPVTRDCQHAESLYTVAGSDSHWDICHSGTSNTPVSVDKTDSGNLCSAYWTYEGVDYQGCVAFGSQGYCWCDEKQQFETCPVTLYRQPQLSTTQSGCTCKEQWAHAHQQYQGCAYFESANLHMCEIDFSKSCATDSQYEQCYP